MGRLARFARPRAGMVALGFLLTAASTAAGMIPPYLTAPLFDRVLIPKQNHHLVDIGLLYWYLGLMAGTAVLAWLLGWARTWVVARVSELFGGTARLEVVEERSTAITLDWPARMSKVSAAS